MDLPATSSSPICTYPSKQVFIANGLETLGFPTSDCIICLGSHENKGPQPLRPKRVPIFDTETESFSSFGSVKIKYCSHTFGLMCLWKWLNISNTCPMCRRVLFLPVHPEVARLTRTIELLRVDWREQTYYIMLAPFKLRLQEVMWAYETTLPELERSPEHLDIRGHAQLLTEDEDAFNNGPALFRRLLGPECNSFEHGNMYMRTTHDVERIGDPRENTLYTIGDPGAVTKGSLRVVKGLIVCLSQLKRRTT